MSYALARPTRLTVDALARATGLHPDLVRRFVSLGLLEATRDAAGELWFRPSDVALVGRLLRLRAAFSLNYAALGLVCDLLDRIDQLEAALRSPSNPWSNGRRTWTSTD